LGLVLLFRPSGLLFANGAFPDASSLSVASAPSSLVLLSTNFGLVRSDDAGSSWSWTCEVGLSAGGTLYGSSVSSTSDRLFTLGSRGLVISDDRACSWQAPAPAAAAMAATDYFIDPQDPMRIWLLASSLPSAAVPDALLVSRDGGSSFAALATAPTAGEALTGVESAARDSSWVVLAAQPPPPAVPRLGLSRDGGASFTWTPLTGLGPTTNLRIVALDAGDPSKLYLRIARIDESLHVNEALAIVTGLDGGGAAPVVTVPVLVPQGTVTAFLRRASGVILVAGKTSLGPLAWRSTDAGASFSAWSNGGLHVRALAEKSATLYAVADELAAGDPFVVATSEDEGTSWHPLLSSFQDLGSLAPCARQACQSTCATNVALGIFPASLCGAPVGEHPDAAPPPADAGMGTPGSGCQCQAGAGGTGSPTLGAWWLAGWTIAGIACARRRARRRFSRQ